MLIGIAVTLLFIVLRLTVTVFNFISNPKLTRVNRLYTDLVSIMIPVRNKADSILLLLNSIKQQDYKHYEVIIWDDNSTDETYDVCSAFVADNARFCLIKSTEPPMGWTGKNFACDRMAQQAAQVLLFADANVIFNKSLINSAVHRMHLYQLGLLSLLPNQLMKTFGEKITVPLMNYLLLNLLPLRLVYLSRYPAIAFACGRFMLFDGAVYRQSNWHQQVKEQVAEDTSIMKRVKGGGYKSEILLANSMLFCRMYKGYKKALSGFSTDMPAVFNNSVTGFMIFILLIIVGPVIILDTLNLNLIFYMGGLVMLARIMISLASGQNALLNLLLHPLQMFNLLIIALISIIRHLTGPNSRWEDGHDSGKQAN